MRLLEETISKIAPLKHKPLPETEFAERPTHTSQALGRLHDILLQYEAIAGTEEPAPPKKCTIVCCADHGVAEMGVSAYPQETTLQMAANYLIPKGTALNVFSDYAGSDLMVVDLGIKSDGNEIPGLINRRIANGTSNFTKGPAMTREQAIASIETGIELAISCTEKGYQCFLPAEMGIGNTTASAAICSVLCQISVEEATDRGTNISDQRLARKIEIIKQAIQANQPNPEDAIDVLAKLGGFELGCIAGILLGAASCHALSILDGFNTSVAALLATALAPACRDYLLPSHQCAEKGHAFLLKKLALSPYINLNLRLGENCGSSIAAMLLDTAIQAVRLSKNPIPSENDPDSPPSYLVQEMPETPPTVTDKTFNFYFQTMPSIDRKHMEACQDRLDQLAKPLHSLGFLEQIAAEVTGILSETCPNPFMNCMILCFTHDTPQHDALEQSFAKLANAGITYAKLRPELPPTAAFEFGRVMSENITFDIPLIGLSLAEDNGQPHGTKAKLLRSALLSDDGSLRYNAEEFLAHVPQELKSDVSALMGALIASAHNSSLILLDDEAVEIIARYAEDLCPDIRPYVLHIQPKLLQLGMQRNGGILACLGKKIVEASLRILNDMKTFEEAKVSLSIEKAP